MSKKVICLGGAGNSANIGKAIVDSNKCGFNEWEFAGFLNDRIETGKALEGYPVLGKINQAQEFVNKGFYFINGVLRIDGNKKRIKLFEELNIPDSSLAIFIHHTAYIAPDVKIGPGCAIMPNACIAGDDVFGKCCLVFQGATIGHNNQIGDFCHISAQACVGAYLNIGKGVHIGMNSTIREHITIGAFSSLGCGSVLLKDIGEEEIWAGSPAKFLRKPLNE